MRMAPKGNFETWMDGMLTIVVLLSVAGLLYSFLRAPYIVGGTIIALALFVTVPYLIGKAVSIFDFRF